MRTLILLEKNHVTINAPYYCGDGCCLFQDWHSELYDAGEEFSEEDQDLTWIFDTRWEEGRDYKWVDKQQSGKLRNIPREISSAICQAVTIYTWYGHVQ